jgi:hypothetical protein
LPPSQKWRLSIDCYGKRHGKRQECESCELSAYCAEAGDIAPLHSVPFKESHVSQSNAESDESSIDRVKAAIEEAKALFAGAIEPIMTLCMERKDLATVVVRHVFKGESYSEVASILRISKQAVQKRMMMAVGMVPSLAYIAPIDARLYRSGAMLRAIQGKMRIKPRKASRKPCEDPQHAVLL